MWYLLADINGDVAAIRADVTTIRGYIATIRSSTTNISGWCDGMFDPVSYLKFVPVLMFLVWVGVTVLLYSFFLWRAQRRFIK